MDYPPLPRPPWERQLHAWYRSCMMTSYSPNFVSFLVSIHSLQEAKSYSEASKYLEWQQAMDEELGPFITLTPGILFLYLPLSNR